MEFLTQAPQLFVGPAKGGIMSKDIGGFLRLPKNIPKNYLKVSHPVHGIDKVLVQFNRLHAKKYYSYEIKIKNRFIAAYL